MEPVDGRNYLACGYCHTFNFPTELDDSADRITPLSMCADVACPVCRQQLLVGAFDEVRIQYCGRCRGVLIPNEAFAYVVRDRRRRYSGFEESPVPIDPREYTRRLDCPCCRSGMEVHPYYGPGSVVIDSCARCHLIWLDHGEIAAIERAPGQRQLAASLSELSVQPAATISTEDTPIDLFGLLFG